MHDKEKLYSFEFLSLTAVSFFAFCNMSVFYSFFGYLDRIGIPVEWRGILVGLEPMSAFLLRLAVMPVLHLGNAATAMIVALGTLAAALCSYGWVVTVPGLIVLRIVHGAGFVLLVSASMAMLVHLIPKDRSAEGFGFVSISVLVPYAVMPLATESLMRHVGNEAMIYRGVTLLAVPAFLLLLVLRKRLKSRLAGADGSLVRRPTMEEIRGNLKAPGIIVLLAMNLFLYLCYASVFFFVKGSVAGSPVTDIGSFFTISTLVMIALRLVGGSFFDRIDKIIALEVFTFLLVPFFVMLGKVDSDGMLQLLAVCYGLSMGFIMPLLNSVLFLASPPHLRGVNTNLALFIMDAAFFLSPCAGGAFIASGGSYGSLFRVCAGFLVVNLVLLAVMAKLGVAARKEADAEGPGA